MLTKEQINQSRFDNGLQFTEKYFLEEINRFRSECGLKTFWDKTEEQHEAMIKGLTFVYMNIVNEDGSQPSPEQIDKWGFIFNQALDNYNRRKTMLALLPLKRYLGLSR